MKIERLLLNRYGHFADFEMALSTQAPGGMCVILGHNEAGKTTLLNAIRDLLFGFGRTSPYNFRYDYNQLAIEATISLADGKRAEIRRKKGAKDALSGRTLDDGGGVDEDWLVGRLGRASRDLFSHVFGFSLSELEKGADLLKRSDMRDALFSASLGGAVDIETVRASLAGDAAEIFKPGGQKPPVNQYLATLKDLGPRQRRAELRADEYQAKQRDIAEAREQRDALSAEIRDLQEGLGLCTRVAGILPRRRHLAALRERLAAITVPREFADADPEEVLALIDRAAKLEEQITEQERRLADLDAKIEAVDLGPDILEHATRIKELTGRIAHHDEAARDLPEVEHQRDALLREISDGLADARPGWGLDDLLSKRPDALTREAFENLAARHQGLRDSRRGLEQQAKTLREAVVKHGQALVGGETSEGVDALRAITVQRERFEHSATRLAEQDELCKGLRSALIAARARLQPLVALEAPAPEAPAPEDLPTPRPEQAEAMATRFAEHRSLVQEQKEALSRTVAAREAEERRLQVDFDGALPTHDGLRECRDVRDALWADLQRTWDGLAADRSELAASFEASMAAADAYADQLHALAETVASRERVVRSIGVCRQTEVGIADRIEALEADYAALMTEWAALFSGCGFEPLEPAAMLRWLADHERCRKAAADLAEVMARQSAAAEQLSELEKQARKVTSDTDTPLRELLIRAEALVQAHDKGEARQDQTRTALEEARSGLAVLESRLVELTRDEGAWAADWASVSTSMGLDGVEIKPAQKILASLDQLRTKLKQAPDLEHRIDRMRTEVRTFGEEAHALCQLCAPHLLQAPPGRAVVSLGELLSSATSAQRQIEGYAKDRLDMVDFLAALRADAERGVRTLDAFRSAAQVADDAALAEVAHRAQQQTELGTEVGLLESEIDQARLLGAAEAFDRALIEAVDEDISVDALRQRAETLREHVAELETQRSAIDQELGRLDQDLRQTLSEAGATGLAEEAEEARAELAAHAERYAVLALAGAILDEEVRRFEREEQPEMVQRASELMAGFTQGRYTQILPSLGEDAELRVLSAQGARFGPGDLSTGTCEQLYLALRLAYTEHYCARSEPLPIVLDDVLVNFDDERASAALATLDELGRRQQVLFFTCHQHLVDLAREVAPNMAFIEIPSPA